MNEEIDPIADIFLRTYLLLFAAKKSKTMSQEDVKEMLQHPSQEDIDEFSKFMREAMRDTGCEIAVKTLEDKLKGFEF